MPSYKSTNFSLTKGDTKTLQLTVKNAAGVAQDITAYTKGRFTIKSTLATESYILRKATAAVGGGADAQMNLVTPTSGILEIYILKTDLVTFATCTITAVAASAIINDEGFTLTDTYNNTRTVKFNKDGGGVTGSPDVTVAVTTGETNSQVATSIASALDAYAWFGATPSSEVVTVTQAVPGATTNNTANADTVADGTFAVTDFSGGLDTPAPGSYLYEVELEHTGGNVFTVLSGSVTIVEQAGNWVDI